MLNLHFSYVVEYTDGTGTWCVKVRFPRLAWWVCFLSVAVGRLATVRGPAQLPSGVIVARRADGVIEFLEPERLDD